jgi:hypothetical protein
VRIFESVLGITLANGEVLRQAILSAAENSDDAEPLGNNGHGEVYILVSSRNTERGCDGSNRVDYPSSRRLPRLITYYIL